jgi:hypothetical protein
MMREQIKKCHRIIFLFLVMLHLYFLPAQAQYGGGTGEPNDPYLIYTAEQMNAIGANQSDWNKHFKLMKDIDLSIFDGEGDRLEFNVVGTHWNTQFTGVFDGNGYTISNLTINGGHSLGLFSRLGSGGEIRNLGVLNVDINGSNYIGGLIGRNSGNVTRCHSTGQVSGRNNIGGLVGIVENQGSVSNSYSNSAVSGSEYIGGLVGSNGYWDAGCNVIDCYSTGEINGDRNIGGLIGYNWGDVTYCYSAGTVNGSIFVGGLVGYNSGSITASYSTGMVDGNSWLGGLLGSNRGDVTHCYSTGTVDGSILVGGLVGYNFNHVTACFWDMETSGQSISNGGTGKTTTNMQISTTFIGWGGWNNESNGVWTIDEENDYPRLWWENAPGHVIDPTRQYLAFTTNPNPIDASIHQDSWVTLSWKPGDYAVSHDVYFGDNFYDVKSGAKDTFQGNQEESAFIVGFNGFPYPDGLIPGITYYWRIDEVNAVEPNSPWKGPVWSFSIPPRTAYNPDPTDGAESVELNVKLSWRPGFDAKLHTVYFGDNFEDVNDANGGIPQGITTYTPGPLELGKTYYWRVDEIDGFETHKGDIWSFITGGAVSKPKPDNGAVDVNQTLILSWIPGIYSDSYQVYFGTDKNAVKNADSSSPQYKDSGDLGFESYDPGKLSMNTTYYWRIDEFNNTNPDSLWIGPVWRFTTANFLIVDDFEAYNDLDESEPESNRLYLTWIDGFDSPMINGSVVGSYPLDPPWHCCVVHSGSGSMWYSYNNGVGVSEATVNIDNLAISRDWTEEEAKVLSLWFYGNPGNDPEPMYFALNGSAVVYYDNSIEVMLDTWLEWRIDLQEFADQGVNLTNINTISIGFGDKSNPVAGGRGEMRFDDIRLYRSAP